MKEPLRRGSGRAIGVLIVAVIILEGNGPFVDDTILFVNILLLFLYNGAKRRGLESATASGVAKIRRHGDGAVGILRCAPATAAAAAAAAVRNVTDSNTRSRNRRLGSSSNRSTANHHLVVLLGLHPKEGIVVIVIVVLGVWGHAAAPHRRARSRRSRRRRAMHRAAQGGLRRGDADLGVGLHDGGGLRRRILPLAGLAIARFGPGTAPHPEGTATATTISVRRGGVASVGFAGGDAASVGAAGLLLTEGTEHGPEDN